MSTLLTMLSVPKPPVKVGDPLAFYEVVATVIPVLAIALIFEAKRLESASRVNDEKPDVGEGKLGKLALQVDTLSELFVGALLLAAGVIGEVAALRVLALQEPTADARYYASGALILLSLGVMTRPLSRALKDVEPGALRLIAYVLVLAMFWGAGEFGASVR